MFDDEVEERIDVQLLQQISANTSRSAESLRRIEMALYGIIGVLVVMGWKLQGFF